MFTVQSLAEDFFEINPDLPVVIRDDKGDEYPFTVQVEDDRIILMAVKESDL